MATGDRCTACPVTHASSPYMRNGTAWRGWPLCDLGGLSEVGLHQPLSLCSPGRMRKEGRYKGGGEKGGRISGRRRGGRGGTRRRPGRGRGGFRGVGTIKL